MPGTGFIARIARHGVSTDRDQREDRLTEICAALFEDPHCRGLAWHVVMQWLEAAENKGVGECGRKLAATRSLLAREPDSWSCTVRTQVRSIVEDHVRRADLVLSFTRSVEAELQEVVICVEVKHGTGPHDGQLAAYQRWLEDRGHVNAAVVLVAPRADYRWFAACELPVEVPRLTWQQTAKAIGGYATGNEVGDFLIGQVCDYLAEEGLVDPDVITPLHLVVLAQRSRADEAIARACDIASDYVCREWDTRRDRFELWGKPQLGLGYWEIYPAARKGNAPRDWTPAWWDWNLRESDASLPDSRGSVPVFTAGLCAERGNAIARGPEGTRWLTDLNIPPGDMGKRFVPVSDTHERLSRIAYPEEILVGRTLQQQGESLGAWIVAAYEALYEAGPPAGANGPTPIPT